MSFPFSSNNVGAPPDKRKLPKFDREVWANRTIVVPKGETWGDAVKTTKVHVGSALGDGSQREDQKPVFVLNAGSVLRNVIISKPGADGVHCVGTCELFNVWWENVGEDALTVKEPCNVRVTGGGAFHAEDKVFQVNAPTSLSIRDFYADGFQTFVRVNGGATFAAAVRIDGSHLRNGGRLVRSDSKKVSATVKNIDLVNVTQTTTGHVKLKKSDIRNW